MARRSGRRLLSEWRRNCARWDQELEARFAGASRLGTFRTDAATSGCGKHRANSTPTLLHAVARGLGQGGPRGSPPSDAAHRRRTVVGVSAPSTSMATIAGYAARRASRLDPVVGSVLRKAEDGPAVRKHRRVAGAFVETTGIEFGQVHDEGRRRLTLATGEASRSSTVSASSVSEAACIITMTIVPRRRDRVEPIRKQEYQLLSGDPFQNG